MIRTIANVVPSCAVDTRQLGWLSGAPRHDALKFSGKLSLFRLTRRAVLALVDRAMAEERDGYTYLEANGFSDAAVDEIDRRQIPRLVFPDARLRS